MYASITIGFSLTIIGAYVCLKWYTYWKRHYHGNLLQYGPYARVRHPLYSGFLSLTFRLAILFPIMETIMLAVFSIAGIIYYIQKEEEYLIRRYGQAYRDYMKRVPWKILPRVY